jgi:hypothetical protein
MGRIAEADLIKDAVSEMALEGTSIVVSVAKARNSAKIGWKSSIGGPRISGELSEGV